MKHLRWFGLAGLAASLLALSLGVGGASATTLEVAGTAKNSSLEIQGSLHALKTARLTDTAGFASNTCTSGTFAGSTQSPFTGSKLTWALSSLTFSSCTRTVTVHKAGKLAVEYSSGTNGTLSSEEAEVTVGSPIGTLTCKTGASTHLGTLTGTASGYASIDINAVLNCGIIPSAKWESTWHSTKPEGLGVVS